MEDGKNVYKAKDVDEFEQKILAFFSKKLPSLKGKAYQVALDRDIKTIGKELKEVYETVLAERHD